METNLQDLHSGSSATLGRIGLSDYVDDIDSIAEPTVLYVDQIAAGQVIKSIDLHRSDAGGAWSSATEMPPHLVAALEDYLDSDDFADVWSETWPELSADL